MRHEIPRLLPFLMTCLMLWTGCQKTSRDNPPAEPVPVPSAAGAKPAAAKPSVPAGGGPETKPAAKPVLAAKEDVDAALNRLKEIGGTFQKSANGAVTSLAVVFKTELKPDDFDLFAKLTDLESIQLFGPEVNDEGFLKLVPLKNLKTVLIENANLSNVSLEVIRDNMPNLTKLALNRIELNNEGLEIVSQMKNVEHLEIRANNIDVFGLLVLGNMEKLKVLDLRNCTSLTDLKYLRKAKNLQVVKLRNAITDRSISSLAECVHLTSVDLQDMEDVSDDSAEALASIPKLRDLSLFRMKYSDEILLKLEGKPLERLLLRGNPNITDKGIPLLKTMKSLNRLNLSELGSVTDESVKAVLEGNTVINNLVLWSMPGLSDETGVALGTMTNLKTLEIRGNSGMTGKTLEAVAALPKLETLTVGESGYPLEDVEKLTALPSLKSLTIYGDKTQVEALIAKIQPQMPNCKISFKGAGGAGE